jgi:predicted permease
MRVFTFAFRSLLKTPVVTTVAVLSVALGIGSNVAIYSIFNQILLRPLPVSEPDRLVNLASPGPRSGSVSCGSSGTCDSVFSYPMYRDLERGQTVFTGIAAHRDFGASIAYGGTSEAGSGAFVSGSYFPVLGLTPHVGRLFDRDDEIEPGGDNVVVLSYDYWRRRFGAGPDVIDQTLRVNGQTLVIVGVAPMGFQGTTFGDRPLLYVPVSMREAVVPRWKGLGDRRAYWAYLFARLRPGVSLEQAQAALNSQYRSILTALDVPLQQGMRPSLLEQFRNMQMHLEPGARGQSIAPAEAGTPLRLLFGVTMIVLLICCANVANLLLGRAATRETEMAVRLSIGAGRKHLFNQLFAESVLLAIGGGLAGLFAARWTLSAMAAILPAEGVEPLSWELDVDMVLFAAALSLATALLFGLFPAIRGSRPNLVKTLRATGSQPSGARSAARFRVVLTTAQIALSMALLVSAGLLSKSLLNIARVDLGLKTEKVVVFGVAPAMNGYTVGGTRQLFETIKDRLAALPGVVGVTSSSVRVVAGDDSRTTVRVQGFASGPDDDMGISYSFVGDDYLRTLGIPLLAGRDITKADSFEAPKVAVVNETFVERFQLGRDAIGKRMSRVGRGTDFDMEIVGVAADSAYSRVKDAPGPVVLFPYRQDPDLRSAHFYVQTASDQHRLLETIRRVVRDIDSTLPITDLRTLTDQVSSSIALDRFVTVMSSAFAALATLLAALGLYGVVAYTVTQRIREFGLRMALGAHASNVRALVLRQVGAMTCLGALIGLGAALALGRAAEGLLFRMHARDPFVFAAATVALAVVALAAGFVPAQRAARVDPMRALRYE